MKAVQGGFAIKGGASVDRLEYAGCTCILRRISTSFK